jgi:hypothetical protein
MERAQDWYAIEAPEQVERFAGELTAAVQRIRDTAPLPGCAAENSPFAPQRPRA